MKPARDSDEVFRGRRGSRENREMYAELVMKADDLEKEFEAHKRRISRDRSDSGRWSKVPTIGDDEENIGGGHGLRGELYDKYMQKRAARLRTDRRLKLAATNEAKLRAMRDDLERWSVELQGKVALPEVEEISDARRRLQKFRSFNTRPSPTFEEGEIDIRRLEEDKDLIKCSLQKSAQRGLPESEASKRHAALLVSRSYERQKDFPVWNPSSSSVVRGGAPMIPRPLNKSTGNCSTRQRAKPGNPLNFRKENTTQHPVISRKANQSVARNIIRARIANDDTQKFRLGKSSGSTLGHKNVSERNAANQKVTIQKTENTSFEKWHAMSLESEPLLSKAKPRALLCEPRKGRGHRNMSLDMDELADIAKVDVLSMMLDKEEGDRDLLEKFSKSVDLEPFLGDSGEQDPGNEASFNQHDERDGGNSTAAVDNAGNDGSNIEGSTIAVKDSQDPRSGQESDESGNFKSANGSSSGSQSPIKLSVNSVSKLPNVTDLKNLEPVIVDNQDGHSTPKETTKAVADAISYEADADQTQKDVENSSNYGSPASYSQGRSRKGILKGFKRFLILSRRSRVEEISAEWLSTTTSEGDDEIFSESIVLEEQVHSLHFPAPTPPVRINQKGGYASERTLKATRLFFSLSSFRCKGDDSKPR